MLFGSRNGADREIFIVELTFGHNSNCRKSFLQIQRGPKSGLIAKNVS